MSEAAKNNNAQVKDNPKTTNIANSNTIIERNSVASPMQAKDGAKAVVISAKEQQEPVKEVKVVSQKTEVKPTESSAFAKEDASSVKAQKAKSVGTEPSKGSPVPNKVEQKSIQNGAISVSPKTISAPQAEHTNQASVKPVPNNSQQGSKTVVMNNQPTTTNTINNANQANKEQPIQGKPLATPVQAASPAVVKTVEEDQKQTQSKEDHKDIFKDLFVKLKSVWQNLNVGVKRYLALVLIPSLICLGYFGLWASPMYISEVKFAVKSAEGGTSGFNLMTTLFRVPTASLQDAMVVEEFLRSNDAFYAADKQLNLIEHYTDQSYDLISRLSFAPTIDDIASFWNNVTKINVNQDSNVITFEVRAYSPEMAKNINEEILHISEDLVNSMNERAKEDMLQLADLEVAEARDRLTVAQDALRDFRNKNQDLDLKATAEGMQSLVIELESQAALLRTQIAEQSRYTDQDAPALKALRDRLVGVEEQIERERSRLTEVSAQGTSLNTLASQYENLVTEAEFARQRLLFAMNSLESAKADILAKNLYIVTVAKPSLPDESLYPKPFLFTFYIFVALSMAYGVISLIVAAIKEHMGY